MDFSKDIVKEIGDDNNNHFSLWVDDGATDDKGNIAFSHEYDGGGTTRKTSGGGDDNDCLTTDTWHYIAFTATSDTVILYLDGETIDQENQTGSPESITDSLTYIGYEEHVDRHFEGMIDDVTIYDDVLTALEITRNYNAGKRSHR